MSGSTTFAFVFCAALGAISLMLCAAFMLRAVEQFERSAERKLWTAPPREHLIFIDDTIWRADDIIMINRNGMNVLLLLRSGSSSNVTFPSVEAARKAFETMRAYMVGGSS